MKALVRKEYGSFIYINDHTHSKKKKKKITKTYMRAMLTSVYWIVIVDPYNVMRRQPSTDAGNTQCNFIRSFHIICILKDSFC